MKLVQTVMLLFVLLQSDAQKEDYIWFIGLDQSSGTSGTQAMSINWNFPNPNPILTNLAYGIDNNNASICDSEGNLLFWSNGCAVMNRIQEVMPNGDTLNWDSFNELTGWDDCSIGYPGAQNIKILPDPAYEDGYYIFHKARRFFDIMTPITTDLRISYVDMDLDGGLGDVVYYDSILYDAPVINANLEAIYDAGGENWWILQPIEGDSLMLSYHLTADGIERMDDQASSVLFARDRSGAGTMRFSPDGTRLAYYDYFVNLHVYDFDRVTGKLTNHKKVIIFEDAEQQETSSFRFGSVEWSPNSRFMYVAVRDSLFQVDSWEEDMQQGIRLIDVYNGTLDPFPTRFYIATQAPDCKIYICGTNGAESYHVIHKPDELGEACDFVQNGLKLPLSSGSANLPLFPRFRVDQEKKCDETISSFFGESVYYRRDLKLSPNPADEYTYIDLPECSEGYFTIYDQTGRCVIKSISTRPENKLIRIELSQLPTANYIAEFIPNDCEEKVIYTAKLVRIDY